MQKLGERECLQRQRHTPGIQLGQLEQVADQFGEALGVLARDFQVPLAFILRQLVILEQQGVDVAVQGRQRRAQVMGDITDQLATKAVVLLQGLELLADPDRHGGEGGAQLADLVAILRANRRLERQQRPGLGVRVQRHTGKSLHPAGQPGEAPGEECEHHQARQEPTDHQCAGGKDTGLADVAVAHRAGQLVVLAAAENHVEIPLQAVAVHDRCCGKHLLPLRIARIGAVDGGSAPPLHQHLQGRQVHLLRNHRLRGQRMAQYPPFPV